jgi:hypothetical protein
MMRVCADEAALAGKKFSSRVLDGAFVERRSNAAR